MGWRDPSDKRVALPQHRPPGPSTSSLASETPKGSPQHPDAGPSTPLRAPSQDLGVPTTGHRAAAVAGSPAHRSNMAAQRPAGDQLGQ
eukprot:8079870-Alexandrium_andersonii.AAC.1